MKMSKSKPDGAVFIHDSVDEIRRKIKKAFCPEGEIEFNPIIDWVEYLVFRGKRRVLSPASRNTAAIWKSAALMS